MGQPRFVTTAPMRMKEKFSPFRERVTLGSRCYFSHLRSTRFDIPLLKHTRIPPGHATPPSHLSVRLRCPSRMWWATSITIAAIRKVSQTSCQGTDTSPFAPSDVRLCVTLFNLEPFPNANCRRRFETLPINTMTFIKSFGVGSWNSEAISVAIARSVVFWPCGNKKLSRVKNDSDCKPSLIVDRG